PAFPAAALTPGQSSGFPAPSGVEAREGNGSVLLSWHGPDQAPDRVRILRSTDGGAWTPIYETQGPKESAYLDSGLSNGSAYRYAVVALAGGKAGDRSEEVACRPRLRIKERAYRSRLSPDLVFVLAGFDSHAGLVGAGILTMSDMLGDKRLA